MNDAVESELRKVELKLEEIGASICNMSGSCVTWSNINSALDSIRVAIRNCYLIEDK